MISRLPRCIPFFFALSMLIKSTLDIMVLNLNETQVNLTYIFQDSIQYGAIAMAVVSLSIFLKRNIWVYLFLGAIIISFFPFLSFNNSSYALYIGSLKLDLIAIPLLVSHVLLNMDAFISPKPSENETEEIQNEEVAYFKKSLSNKSDTDLLSMDESQLVPSAIEVRKLLLLERGL